MREKDNSLIFLSYNKMNIFPQQVNKTKYEYELAVSELSNGIADLSQENNRSAFQKIHNRLEEVQVRFRK